MTPLAKRQLRAALYRDLAHGAATTAAASLLSNVREKHERSAARWAELAAMDEPEKDLSPCIT
jgi:hypothetical protein